MQCDLILEIEKVSHLVWSFTAKLSKEEGVNERERKRKEAFTSNNGF